MQIIDYPMQKVGLVLLFANIFFYFFFSKSWLGSYNSECPDISQKLCYCYWSVAFVSKKSWNSENDIVNQKDTGIGKMRINFPNKVGPLKSVQAE